MNKVIYVTKKDIEEGHKNMTDPNRPYDDGKHNCMVGLAILRAFKTDYAKVGFTVAEVGDTIYGLPQFVTKAISKSIATTKIKPFKFVLKRIKQKVQTVS